MATQTLYEHSVSDLQSNVVITGNKATGTLKYVSTGALPDYWGPGNFLALKWSVPEDATSLLVGLVPSEGSGLVEAIDDTDRNGVFKITDKDVQIVRLVVTTPEGTTTTDVDISGLVCEDAPEETVETPTPTPAPVTPEPQPQENPGDNQGGTDTSTTYTQEQLEEMTKQQIADLATSLGYTVNSNKTKAEMIEQFLTQQAGGAPEQGADPDPSAPDDPGTGGDNTDPEAPENPEAG